MRFLLLLAIASVAPIFAQPVVKQPCRSGVTANCTPQTDSNGNLAIGATGATPYSCHISAVSSIDCTHNLNTNTPWVGCYDNSGNMLGSTGATTSVTSVVATSANVVTLTFSGSTTGTCVISTGSMGATGATGATGTGYGGTSATSMTPGTTSGATTITASTGLAYQVGSCLQVASSGAAGSYIIGPVTAYNATTGSLTFTATTAQSPGACSGSGGSGAHTDWALSLSGVAGQNGAGTGTVTGPGSSTDTYIPVWSGTSGTVLGAGIPQASLSGTGTIFLMANSIASAGSPGYTLPGSSGTITTNPSYFNAPVPAACVMQNLYAVLALSATVTTADAITFTLYSCNTGLGCIPGSGSPGASTLTCTMAAGQSSCSDTSHTLSLAAGTSWAMKVTSTDPTARNFNAVVQCK